MSGLIFACIAPHGSMIIPLLGEKGAEKALATRAAMEELGRRVAAAQPETLVVITPHGHRVDGCFSLLNNRRVQGTLGPEPESNGHSFTLTFEVDKELNAAIVEDSPAPTCDMPTMLKALTDTISHQRSSILLSYEVPTYFGMMCVAYEPA